MPFLLPALVALSSDAVVLVLGRRELLFHHVQANNDKSTDESSSSSPSSSWVYRIYYLVFLSLIRAALVLAPLLFHSYTGTALKCPKLYQLLYGGTLLMILVHMLCLSLLNPESLEAIIPFDSAYHHHSSSASSSEQEELDAVHQLRRIWWILALSLLSDVCHWIMLLHVRSSAPDHPLLTGKKKHPSIYFTLRSVQQEQQQRGGRGRRNRVNGESISALISSNGMPASYDDDDEHDERDHHHSNNMEDEEPALMHAMSDFVEEMRVRLQRTQADWAARLEDFTARHLNNPEHSHHHNHSHHHHRMGGMRSIHNPLQPPLTPFRVLLQLFADEDSVMNDDYDDDNGDHVDLDVVFEMDGGSSMTFFVPQLLSFLLHGALRKSQSLERWILDKCSRNIHFAHQCYWFLRSWCLEQQSASFSDVSIRSLSRPNSEGNLLSYDLSNREVALPPFLDEPAQPTSHLIPCGPNSRLLLSRDSFRGGGGSGGRLSVSSSHNKLPGGGAAAHEKLLPEERAMIERLMLRVKECGETAAEALAYGLVLPSSSSINDGISSTSIIREPHPLVPASLYGSDALTFTESSHQQQPHHHPLRDIFDITSPSNLMALVESGVVPVDPISGCPSVKHLDSIACSAHSKYGFLPLADEALQLARLSHATTAAANATMDNDDNYFKKNKNARQILPLPPPGAPFPLSGTSSSTTISHRETVEFDKTSQFLDALLFLAGSLFSVPAAHRKEELMKQLRLVECELLPSNVIYVPIGNVHHRVWRIVAEESVCIGTKERVPCIVCLEVVDYAPPIYSGSSSNSPSKRSKRPRAWNFLDRLQQQQQQQQHGNTTTSINDISSESLHEHQKQRDLSVSPSQTRRSTIEGLELPDMTMGSTTATTTNTTDASSSEVETVNEWRYGRRDPLRRSTIFDKVSSSVRGSMKGLGPLDKMKSQILSSAYNRDVLGGNLPHLPPRHEELLSLNKNIHDHKDAPPLVYSNSSGSTTITALEKPPPPLVTGIDSGGSEDDFLVGRSISCGGSAAAAEAAVTLQEGTNAVAAVAALDPESLLSTREQRPPLAVKEQRQESTTTNTTANSVISLSRNTSTGSLASMGQWTSPKLPNDGRPIVQLPSNSNGSSKNNVGPLFHQQESESCVLSLQYGSDHDEDLATPLSTGGDKKHPSNNATTNNSNGQHLRNATYSSGKEVATKSLVGGVGRRPPVVFRESWQSKQDRLRSKSAYGHHPGWRLLPILIKANDDLRQEQLASQLIYRMAAILSREKVPVWLCPYEIIALTENGGIVEAIPDTISLDSLKRNDPNFRGLKYFFGSHYGEGTEELADAQANFVESLAAYSIVCFLLQLKDRHNGNILLDNRGHIIHIDFGFFFLSSPGKNVGFESAPFKLTRDFVELLGGPSGRLFKTFRDLCIKTFLTLRKHCMEIILLVEMVKTGNEDLNCFRGRPDEAIRQLRERFRLDLNDRACREYVNCLVDDSIENWRTDWYDRYQRYCVGVL